MHQFGNLAPTPLEPRVLLLAQTVLTGQVQLAGGAKLRPFISATVISRTNGTMARLQLVGRLPAQPTRSLVICKSIALLGTTGLVPAASSVNPVTDARIQ